MSAARSLSTALALAALPVLALPLACQSGTRTSAAATAGGALNPDRPYLVERVDDVAIVQLYADGFERLEARDKELVWHLYEAAIAGRDIFWQQKCTVGLELRDLVEEILVHGEVVDATTLARVRRYANLLWVNSSPYHYTTKRKFVLEGSPGELALALEAVALAGADLPTRDGESVRAMLTRLEPWLFDPDHVPLLVAEEGGPEDVLEASAVSFYGPGVTLAALEGFEEEYALNANVELDANGAPVERVWRLGDGWSGAEPGLYAAEIGAIAHHLQAALPVAPEPTRLALEALIRFYRTGSDADREAYDIAWVRDATSTVDTINGFVEVYQDPRGRKGSWEGIVFYEDPEKAELIQKIAAEAQWFEDRMPYDDAFKKPEVRGISARSIDVVIETGDAGPVTAIGINLPNDVTVREEHGSKSVSLANVKQAYALSTPQTSIREFAWDDAEVARYERWASLTGDMLTNMHEAIGHASGRQDPDHQGDPAQWLGDVASPLEEARADLVALWFMMDPKLEELGLIDDVDDAALACYESYTRNGGMLQLRRMRGADRLKQAHMRDRQMIVRWIEANSNAIETRERDGKHYLVVRDAAGWREAAGRLLAIVQELKSTGNRAGAVELFERYGTTFDLTLRDEVVARYDELGLASYTGFVMPRLEPQLDADGAIVDVRVSYPLSLEQQMLEWSGRRAAPGVRP